MHKAKTFGDEGAISVPSTIHIEGTRAAVPRTLKTTGSDLTQKGSLDVRPDVPENQVRLTRNPSQKDIFDSDFVSV